MIADKIITIARSYIGQKETANNSGFADAAFLKKMKFHGWYPGAPWCCFFVKIVWFEAYAGNSAIQKLFMKYASGSTRETFFRFRTSKEFKVRDFPVLGAIVIFQHGSGTTGHAGVVTKIGDSTFLSVEGNTNASGGREGIEVAEQTRLLHKPFTKIGLNILGFIHPIAI